MQQSIAPFVQVAVESAYAIRIETTTSQKKLTHNCCHGTVGHLFSTEILDYRCSGYFFKQIVSYYQLSYNAYAIILYYIESRYI